MSVLLALDYFGVFVFAVSGALMALRKQMDLFGVLVLALLPAVGGGTLRDLLLDVPVFWIEDTNYLVITGVAALFTYFSSRFVHRRTHPLAWADALGLSVFCVLGAAKGYSVSGDALVALVMGVMTAVAGGIARDVVANEVPYILRREVYATAALAGSGIYLLLVTMSVPFAEWIGVAAALLVRGLGILRGWSLPSGKADLE